MNLKQKHIFLGGLFKTTRQKSQSEKDTANCEILAKQINETKSVFNLHHSVSTTDGERTVTYYKTKFPSVDHFDFCYSRSANNLEKEWYKD